MIDNSNLNDNGGLQQAGIIVNREPEIVLFATLSKYKTIFFDLDHTLWDFERNAEECLLEIYEDAHLHTLGVENAQTFVAGFQAINNQMWHLFDTHQITHIELRTTRFKKAMEQIGIKISDNLSENLNALFLDILPRKGHLIDGSIEVLDYLFERYPLHLITNGFHEVQHRKLRSSGINHYFEQVISSENSQSRKPEKAIFDYALKITGAEISSSIMIGDNYDTDIMGAMNFGMDTVYFNPENKKMHKPVTFDIQNLLALKTIL
jgi:putative hydrolase of the HAD superfamily